MRVVCVWLPTWPTDRLRHRPGAEPSREPLVVAERRGARRVVVAVDAAARALGVSVGSTVALAQAMTPGLRVVEAEPAEDAAALERLAGWALRYTPVTVADPPDGLVMDVAGATHLHGGEAGLLADATTRLARAGIAAQAALAPTWAAAWALARHAPGTVAPIGAGLDAIAMLPVAALRLDAAMVVSLGRVGIDTVAELAMMPRASLALRFGRAAVGRLDAAAGRAHEAIEPVLAPTIPFARRVLAEPLGHLAGLERVLGDLAGELCAALERLGLGATRFDLRLHRVDGAVAALRVGASRATRDAALRPVRLGLCLVAGLAEKDAARLVGAQNAPYSSIDDLQRRARLGVGALSRLAEADAYGSLALTRRGASWAIKALHDAPLPLFEAADAREGGIAPEMPEAPVRLKPPTAGREVVDDYAALGFSLRAHPVSFLRGMLERRRFVRSADLAGMRDGAGVRVAGLVLVRQRPDSAKGVMFLTLEDETGPSNVIVWPSLVDRHRRVLFAAGMMGVAGRLQREGSVEHVIADRLVDLSPALARVGERGVGQSDAGAPAWPPRSASRRRTTSTPTC